MFARSVRESIQEVFLLAARRVFPGVENGYASPDEMDGIAARHGQPVMRGSCGNQ